MKLEHIDHLYAAYLQHPIVTTDTRNLPQQSIFFALKGENFNGNTYANQALADGAAYVVVDELIDDAWLTDERVFVTENVLATLQQLALTHRNHLDIPFLAITGSNGKTTTKELIYTVMSQKYKTVATKGNLNNHIGVPLTILSIPTDAEFAIIEMGANHLHEIESYCTIAKPNFAIINNCGKAHLEGFGSLEGVKKAKGELYDFIRMHQGSLFINTDLDYLQEMAEGINTQYTYGTANAHLIGKDISDTPFLKVAILTHLLETSIQTQLIGSYNLPNVLAAVAVGHHFGVAIEVIKSALEAYTPSNSRSQLVKTAQNEVILDAYNANPTSMDLAIKNLAQVPHTKKVLMLGSMKELGADSIAEHQKIIDTAHSFAFEAIYVVGPEFAATTLHHARLFATSADLKAHLAEQPISDALILVKGSRGSKMEVVMDAL